MRVADKITQIFSIHIKYFQKSSNRDRDLTFFLIIYETAKYVVTTRNDSGPFFWSAYRPQNYKKIIQKIIKAAHRGCSLHIFYNFLSQFSYNFERSDHRLW